MTSPGSSVLGWGYEGKTVEDLLSDAKAWAVVTVVDVRLNPISRKRGFSKKGLTAELEANGIKYVHLPALGNPKDNRAGFAEVGTADGRAARERFASEVLETDEASVALATVAELSDAGTVLLLCFEAKESCCHRAQVLSALQETRQLLSA